MRVVLQVILGGEIDVACGALEHLGMCAERNEGCKQELAHFGNYYKSKL